MSLDGFKKISLMQNNMFMSITNNGIGFSKNTILELGSPKYVVMLFNRKTSQIALQSSDGNDSNALVFLKKDKKAANGVRINNRRLQSLLAKTMNWDIDNNIYRVSGIYSDTDQAMIFDLTNAKYCKREN